MDVFRCQTSVQEEEEEDILLRCWLARSFIFLLNGEEDPFSDAKT